MQNAESPQTEIELLLFCPVNGRHEDMRFVTQMLHETADPMFKEIKLLSFRSPDDTVSKIRETLGRKKHPILITMGPHEPEVISQLSPMELSAIERLVVNLLGKSVATPAESLGPNVVLRSHELNPAIRRLVVRVALSSDFDFRVLSEQPDVAILEQYFALRYKVWNQRRYIPQERKPAKCKLELHYTDFSSIPLAAFHSKRLVGCARLVFEPGRYKNIALQRTIEQLASTKGDPQLLKNLEFPKTPEPPFDVLVSFAAFGSYFSERQRRGIKMAEVSRVIVDPAYRNKGLGFAIVDRLIALAGDHHVRQLFLACRPQHEGFYSRSGFKRIVGLETGCFVDVRQEAIAMDRELLTNRGSKA